MISSSSWKDNLEYLIGATGQGRLACEKLGTANYMCNLNINLCHSEFLCFGQLIRDDEWIIQLSF